MAMFLEGTQGHRKIFGQVALEALEQVFFFCFSLKTYGPLVPQSISDAWVLV